MTIKTKSQAMQFYALRMLHFSLDKNVFNVKPILTFKLRLVKNVKDQVDMILRLILVIWKRLP